MRIMGKEYKNKRNVYRKRPYTNEYKVQSIIYIRRGKTTEIPSNNRNGIEITTSN